MVNTILNEMRGHYLEGLAWMAGLSAGFWMLTVWFPATIYALSGGTIR